METAKKVLTKDAILEAYRYRHACKEFDSSKKISDEDFEFILETGRLSPSSFGIEPWKFVVIQNAELREKLLPFTWGAQKQLPTSSHFVVILSRTPKELLAESDYVLHIRRDIQGMPEDRIRMFNQLYHKFLETDFGLLGNERAMFEWACRQTYIALGNMMTAAAQIGIDSCPIEGFDKEKAEQVLREAGVLRDDRFGISCMVAFGYRANEPRDKTRRPIDQVTEWVK